MRFRAGVLAVVVLGSLSVGLLATAGARTPTPLATPTDFRLLGPTSFTPTPQRSAPTFAPPTPGPSVVVFREQPEPTAILQTPKPRPRPTPRPAAPRSTAHSVSGVATYYCCTAHYGNGLYAAAGPALRAALGGDPAFRGRYVRVCYRVIHCVRVRLVDWCACKVAGQRRIIDLEPAAFSSIAPLSRGEVTVTVSW